jgi:hypothetical protein
MKELSLSFPISSSKLAISQAFGKSVRSCTLFLGTAILEHHLKGRSPATFDCIAGA